MTKESGDKTETPRTYTEQEKMVLDKFLRAQLELAEKRRKGTTTGRKRKSSSSVKKRATKKTSKNKISSNRPTAAPKKKKTKKTKFPAASSARSTQARLKDCHVRVELSPNARSKCQCCGKKIERKQERVVVSKPSRTRYYHLSCVQRDPRFVDLRDALLSQRSGQEHLRRLSAIVDNSITDNLRKKQSESSPEIIVIDDSDDDVNDDSDDEVANNTMSETSIDASALVSNQSDDDSDDDAILYEETLTCAQVIQQKFDRAAANGEIVAID